MQGCIAFLKRKLYDTISCLIKTVIPNQIQIQNCANQFEVFITHRGDETKRNLAVLVHDDLMNKHKIRAFLDYKSMKPGDKLYETIDFTICECKIGFIIFSPKFCESSYCLHELALLVEMKKKLIPIFCDVRTDQLEIIDDGKPYDSEDVERFRYALEVAKSTVGIKFNTSQGDWSQLVEDVSTSVKRILSNI